VVAAGSPAAVVVVFAVGIRETFFLGVAATGEGGGPRPVAAVGPTLQQRPVL